VPATWHVHWEAELDDALEAELAAALADIYPDDAGRFQGRAWAGARPEVRVVGRDDDGRIVAHVGMARRFLRTADGAALLVADTGLVGTVPAARGTGLGRELLAEAARVARELDAPFGFLTCGERVVGFYESCGWIRGANPVLGIDLDDGRERWEGPAMHLPVRAPAESWPAGELQRNAREI
jgi:nodulation protein A